MRGSIGLLLYVAVMVLGSILKKIAEDKNRQVPRTVIDDEPYTVTLDDMLAEAPAQEWNAQEAVESLSTPVSSEGSAGEFGSQDRQFFSERDGKDGDWDWRESEDDADVGSEEVAFVPRKLNLRQAIIMSEIIREPRAKRPWPGR